MEIKNIKLHIAPGLWMPFTEESLSLFRNKKENVPYFLKEDAIIYLMGLQYLLKVKCYLVVDYQFCIFHTLTWEI